MKMTGVVVLVVVFTGMMSIHAAEISVDLGMTVAADHPNTLAMMEFKKIVEHETNSRVKIDVFPANQLGNEVELLEGCMLGSVDMFVVSSSSLSVFQPEFGIMASQFPAGSVDMFVVSSSSLSVFQPEFGIMASPYVFNDIEHMIEVASGEIGQDMAEALLETHGIRLLANNWYYGTRHLTSKTNPIYRPGDLTGELIRTVNTPIMIETVKALGGTPTPIAFSDLYMALKQGTVEGQENPIPTIYTYKFYEGQKYLMLTGHIIMAVHVGVNDAWYQQLPQDVRMIMEEAMPIVTAFNNDLTRQQEIEMLNNLQEEGMIVIEPDVDAFRTAAEDVHVQFNAAWGEGLYERIRKRP